MLKWAAQFSAFENRNKKQKAATLPAKSNADFAT
jgi:hypothetical protein